DEAITLNGMGETDFTGSVIGALESTNPKNSTDTTDATLTGPVTLATAAAIGGDNDSKLTITGDLTGTGDLNKIGLSPPILPNANLGFTGNTLISGGVLTIKNKDSLGPTPPQGGVITVNNSGTLQLQGSFNISKPLTLNGFGFNSQGALKLFGGSSTVDT